MDDTRTAGYLKARSVNQTSASWVAKPPVTSEPTGDAATATGASVISASGNFGAAPSNGAGFSYATISVLGKGSDNQTVSMRLYAISSVLSPAGVVLEWVETLLGEFLCTLSANAGCQSTMLATDGTTPMKYADTISLVGTTANSGIGVEIVSPADDANIAYVKVDLNGAQKIEPTFKVGTASEANAIVKLY